ncbi:unnamed protein product [Rotaria magnacalcarata]|uniref:Uncharacterized protein n=3 Tax=Rotaria magnacalcarata TaxID=392030 RepID=A0A819DPE6_9BILA|nr:unnamed protein product [Rotaria magnacalcarata]CAF3944051.1 unnamed protein product [Rotaria magnacalcarata]
MVILATDVYATSIAHTVFLPSDRSLNPFSDQFIQRVINMDREKLFSIPQMDDAEFLLKLSRNDDSLGGSFSRAVEDDPYEIVFDDKLDDQLALQDNIDGEWVHLMTAGPLTVNYIGNLLVLAITGSMYSALLGAHTAMDRIQLNVQQVPNHIKTALKLVLVGSPMLIEIMLPKSLEAVGRIANESAAHARTTFQKFSSLQELIGEIIEANTYTHSSQSNIVDKIQEQINAAKQDQAQLNSNMNSIKAQYEDARREMEKARQEYQVAFNAIPTFRGWFKKIFRKIVNVVVSIITYPARILGCILGLCYNNQAALAAAAAAAETAKQNAIAKANHLLQVLQEAEKRHTAFAAQQAAEQQKIADMMKKIAALDLDRMSEQEIVDILIESILQMNQIKEQWGRLIIVQDFIGAIKDAQASNLLIDASDREFFVEILSITCQEIERGAHLLYVMSKTYFDISSEYMINQIATINTLLLLQTNSERSSLLRSLSSNTTITSTKIIQLAQERQNEYASRNKARRDEYQRFLAKLAEEDLEMVIG